MSGYNFTDRVRKIQHLALEEAIRRRQDDIKTEHLLLGIISEGEGVAVAALTNLGVDLEAVRRDIEERTDEGKPRAAPRIELPYSRRAKKVLEYAMTEARELNHSYVGTEHLLLGVLREKKGLGAQVLVDAGVTLERARVELVRMLGDQFAAGFAQEADQWFKTGIALVELHRIRFGAYPSSLDELAYLGTRDRAAVAGLRYERLAEGYALEIVMPRGSAVHISYAADFWRRLGIRRTNVDPLGGA